MKTWSLSPVRPLGLALLLCGGTAIAPGIRVCAQRPIPSQAQNPLLPALSSAQPPSKHAKHPPPEPPLPKPSIVIPVGPLGFAPPAAFYLGDRVAQVSLNFLDEDSVLFAFRVPGLIAREHTEPEQTGSEDPSRAERHVRALVLSLPTGKVTAEAMWRLHDYGPFLWMLEDQHFLLRDRNTVQLGDSSLHMEPFLRFPGMVKYIELDPNQHLLVADTSEPAPVTAKQSAEAASGTSSAASSGTSTGNGPASASNSSPSPNPSPDSSPDSSRGSSSAPSPFPTPAAPGSFTLDGSGGKPAVPETQNLLRILNMDTGKVMLVSRVSGIINLSLDGEGYYEALRGNGLNWLITYADFSGNATPVEEVESTCYPTLDAMAPGLVMASACTDYGGRRLTVLARDPKRYRSQGPDSAQNGIQTNVAQTKGVQTQQQSNRRLWDVSIPPTKVWPLFTRASEGLRIARATLDVTHPVSPSTPLDMDDIRGQSVQVYDLATGKLELTAAASPILDGGGGFALSPSGKRFAVLNAGAIQIYDLPPAPALAPALSALPTTAHSGPTHTDQHP